MIVGTGIDIVKNARFEKWLKDERLLERFFHPDEIEYVKPPWLPLIKVEISRVEPVNTSPFCTVIVLSFLSTTTLNVTETSL